MAGTKKAKDLTPKTPAKVKGGGVQLNANFTMVRHAKPATKKDLTPKTTAKVKGGSKRV